MCERAEAFQRIVIQHAARATVQRGVRGHIKGGQRTVCVEVGYRGWRKTVAPCKHKCGQCAEPAQVAQRSVIEGSAVAAVEGGEPFETGEVREAGGTDLPTLRHVQGPQFC